MTKFVSLYEAKVQLPDLVDRAAAGEEIVIAKNGMPFAKLVPLPNRGKPRKPDNTDEDRVHRAGPRRSGPGDRAAVRRRMSAFRFARSLALSAVQIVSDAPNRAEPGVIHLAAMD